MVVRSELFDVNFATPDGYCIAYLHMLASLLKSNCLNLVLPLNPLKRENIIYVRALVKRIPSNNMDE